MVLLALLIPHFVVVLILIFRRLYGLPEAPQELTEALFWVAAGTPIFFLPIISLEPLGYLEDLYNKYYKKENTDV